MKQTKRILSLLLSLVMLFSITAGLDFSSYANTSGDYAYTVLSNGTAEITRYNGNSNNVSIPSVVAGYRVTSIGDCAFDSCENLTTVKISNGIVKIGSSAFESCSNLINVEIPNSVTNIGVQSFYECISLASINIPNSITSIGSRAFSWCGVLDNVIIPGSVKTIGEGVFEYCYGLKKVAIMQGIENVPSQMFYQCNSLESIELPDSLKTIGKNAFLECDSLKNITIPKNVYSIGEYALGFTDYNYEDELFEKVDNFNMNCCANSEAERYAKKNGLKYTLLSCINHTYKTTTTKATISKNGSIVTKCSVCGTVSKNTVIYYPKTISLSATSYTYNGKVKKPSVTVKDAKGKKIDKNYYTVTYSKGRKNVGKYTVTIKFKGNYSGTIKKTFTIKPKATSVSKVTAGKKAFTVKWKKQATQTTGYQIQYSTDKNFKKNNKTVTVAKNKTTSKKISKLKAKKKYYVRIRTYKTVKVNGKSTKIYSSWSKAKTVTTKK